MSLAPTSVGRRRRFPWLIYCIVLVLIGLFAMSPVSFAVLAGAIGDAHGCKVDEGSVHPCMVNGVDWGGPLYAIGVLGWFVLLTFPVGFVLFIVWLVVLLVHRARWRKRPQ